MSDNISIIAYHYVRDIKGSKYPKINGLEVNQFNEQVEYLRKNFNIIRMEDAVEAFYNKLKLPENAVLLTFDDGYIDHYQNVFPILKKKNIPGSFFISGETFYKQKVLEANKIHFTLSNLKDEKVLVKDIFSLMDKNRETYNLKTNEEYFSFYKNKGYALDSSEVRFIKKILQVELPAQLRSEMIDHLFKKYVTDDEKSFSQKLYLNHDQIKEMKIAGMHIGSHSMDHQWLGIMKKEEQEYQMEWSVKFLKDINSNHETYTICYPFGSYNEDTIELALNYGLKMGFSTRPYRANLKEHHPLSFPRLDTNEFPRNRKALT